MKRTPSKVAAEAIRELAREQDEQRQILESQQNLLREIKGLLVQLSREQGDHRQHAIQSISDLGERVLRLERAR